MSAPGRPLLALRRAVAVAASGGVLVLVAFVFDAVPLFVPGVALVAIGALAPAWVWTCARGARARRVLAAERVVEDEPLEALIEVRRGLLGLPGAEIVDPLSGSRLRLAEVVRQAGAGRTTTLRVSTHFHRRGEHALAPPSLIVGDPLDLARIEVRSPSAAQTLLVLPRTEPVRWLSGERGRRLEAPVGDANAEAMAATEFESLRPYRPGTPASRIHWPAVARGRGLIERKLQADGDSRPLVVLDARQRETEGERASELLDAAVRATASLVLDLARAGGCGLLLPGEQRATTIDPELQSWPAAYGRLALVRGGESGRSPALGRHGPLIYVTAASRERIGTGLTGSGRGGGPTVIVVPIADLRDGRPRGIHGRMLPTLEVSGCRGFVLGARRDAAPGPPESIPAAHRLR